MDEHAQNRIPQHEVRRFYDLLPRIYEDEDVWHHSTHQWVENFIESHRERTKLTKDSRILNAGSGGLTCPFPEENVYHVDIAPKKLKDTQRSFVADIHELPFEDGYFDTTVCVGSVLNYCDAPTAIASLSRVTKSGGYIFIEFETSAAWDYAFSNSFMQSAVLVTTFYNHRKVRLWVYSEKLIASILTANGFIIKGGSRRHILSPLVYRLFRSESFAARFSRFDALLRHIPFVRRFCSNIIFFCEKRPEV